MSYCILFNGGENLKIRYVHFRLERAESLLCMWSSTFYLSFFSCKDKNNTKRKLVLDDIPLKRALFILLEFIQAKK